MCIRDSITLVGIFSISALNALPGLAVSPILGDLNKIFPSATDLEDVYKRQALDAGNYVMVTGTRLANGGVLSQLTFFTIKPGETTTVDLVMRESKMCIRDRVSV